MTKEQRIEEMANVIRKANDNEHPILRNTPAEVIREKLIDALKADELRWLVDAGYGNLREFAEKLTARLYSKQNDETMESYGLTREDIDELLKEYNNE